MTLPWGEFAAVWLFLAANIATPGPNVLNTVALALGSGRAAGMGSAAGVGLGIGLWCLGMVLGVAAVIGVLPGAQAVLTGAAVVLLSWFAWRYLRAAWRGFRARGMALPQGQDGAGFATGFRRALAVNAVNPKALTSWLAVLGMFPLQAAGPGDVAILCAGACVASFAIHGIYVILFSTVGAARLYLRAGWVLQALAGFLFAGFALRLVAGG
ncbi:LysE family translocator [Paragemmobacter ruber]|uniref:LysE family transporter n=1 Tax=Paragemmobacter ruber TaxID=1985673 RepID=A0ABW9Y4P6_9RHOB|nr:LysE family translocator [Rhodobacter ruber]NBE07479.1 LysE family transporter [Rhodobacter ruber]